jgi:hypothetical protein
MINENTDAQVKAQIIQRINALKPDAIAHGFDYPTQAPETATVEELLDFLVEVSAYIGAAASQPPTVSH